MPTAINAMENKSFFMRISPETHLCLGIIYFSCRLSFIDRKSRISGDRSTAVGGASAFGASETHGTGNPPSLLRRTAQRSGAAGRRKPPDGRERGFRCAAVAASLHPLPVPTTADAVPSVVWAPSPWVPLRRYRGFAPPTVSSCHR